MVSCPPASEQQRKVFVGRHTFIFCFHLDRVPRYFAANSATQFVLRAAVLLARALERCFRDVSALRLRGKNAAAHPCWNVGFTGAHRNVVTVIQRISTTPKNIYDRD